MAEKKYTPILPFDGTLNENFMIYDNQTYHQNIDYITPEKVKKDSGNIVKYYRCSDVKPCYIGETRPEEDEEENVALLESSEDEES